MNLACGPAGSGEGDPDEVVVQGGAPIAAPPGPAGNGEANDPATNAEPPGARPEILPIDGVIPLAWSDLSLQDLTGEHLRALLYPEEFNQKNYRYPEAIQRYHGKRVSVVGYMLPAEIEHDSLPAFMLVRDLLGCCFGGIPQPDEWVQVDMAGDPATYFPYQPVRVTGELSVGGFEDEYGIVTGSYKLQATEVERER